jgi:DNA-binding MarR family transcriptional regulator
MASQALASNNPSRSSRGKSDEAFSREMLRDLFRTANLSPCEYTLIVAMWEAAGRPTGKEIHFFAAVEGYRIEARWKSRRTVQRNLRRLEQRGLIKLTHGANTIRRPATYQLHTDRLGKRQTYMDVKSQRKAVAHFPRSESTSSPDAPPEASPTVQPAARPQPSPAAPAREHRQVRPDLGSRSYERIKKQRHEFAARFTDHIRGRTSYVEEHSGIEIQLQPGNSGHRFKLPRDKAFLRTCQDMRITEEEGRELMKALKFDVPEMEEGP